jgi:vacuolar-type H+-ATPase subunit I/STV1
MKNTERTMEFTADQVWACAAAAHRINEGYFKEEVWMHNATPPYRAKQANKALVKEWLRTNDFIEVTEADYAAGRRARDHFKSYTLLMIAGKLNEFQQTALKIATKDTFTGRDLYDFAVISCLPEVAERDQQRTDLKREIYQSEQLTGEVGDVVQGDITVVRSRYSKEYNKYRIDARMGESFVDFWFTKELKGELRIKGKVKNVRGNKTTQLNYVKIVS